MTTYVTRLRDYHQNGRPEREVAMKQVATDLHAVAAKIEAMLEDIRRAADDAWAIARLFEEERRE